MVATTLLLASDRLISEAFELTRRACDAWRARWGIGTLDLDVCATSCERGARPKVTGEGRWLDAGGSAPCTVFWPDGLESVVANAIYPRQEGEPVPQSGTMARASAARALEELRKALASAWQVSDSFADASASWRLSRWVAPLQLTVTVDGGLQIVAVVAGSAFRRGPADVKTALGAVQALDARAFEATPARVQVIVGHATVALPDLAALQPGDVLVLDSLVSDPLEVCTESGHKVLHASMGRDGSRRAIQVFPFVHQRSS